MARKDILDFELYICLDGQEEPVPFESVPAKKMDEIQTGWAERLSGTLSRYYTAHPDEYRNLHL